MSHEEELWAMLPTCVGESIGIRNIAELMGLSVDRTLRLLWGLESRGARCTKGDLVEGVLRYHYWWREPDPHQGDKSDGLATVSVRREIRRSPR